MRSEINKVREKLHKELKYKKNVNENVIEISEELDQLIIQYYLKGEKGVEE